MSVETLQDGEGSSSAYRRLIDEHIKDMHDLQKLQSCVVDAHLHTTDEHKTEPTTSDIGNFSLGTGAQMLNDILPAIQAAQSEVIIVTCFWARSESQRSLGQALRQLAKRAQKEDRHVVVTICFSSLSIWQKLTHTRSLDGHIYPPKTWPTQFGLPDEDELKIDGPNGITGISLTIKSIFVRPFSVMHPKFIIIDRRHVILPSCNVSWENWLEGCIELRGDIVPHFLNFYRAFWERENKTVAREHRFDAIIVKPKDHLRGQTEVPNAIQINLNQVDCLLLPSYHHSNPRFRPFWFQLAPKPLSTPLNDFLLTAFSKAQEDIYIQTPNLTSPPVLSALYSALERGINVRIVTCARMMMLEQLFTAGTITEWSVRSFKHRYDALRQDFERQQKHVEAIEEARPKPGRLSVRYYKPRDSAENVNEPVKSHLKLTVVDGCVVILGSGNMDRASWYTSQELGVAFFSAEMAEKVSKTVAEGLEGRLMHDLVTHDSY